MTRPSEYRGSSAATVRPAEEKAWRDGAGRFQKGNGASKGHASGSVRTAIAPLLPKLIAQLEQLAEAGDTGATRVAAIRELLARGLGPAAAETKLPSIPAVVEAKTLGAKAAAISDAVASAALSVEQAAAMLRVLSDAAALAAVDAFDQRLSLLEDRFGIKRALQPAGPALPPAEVEDDDMGDLG